MVTVRLNGPRIFRGPFNVIFTGVLLIFALLQLLFLLPVAVSAQEKPSVVLVPDESPSVSFGYGLYARAVRLANGSHLMAYEDGYGSVAVALSTDDGFSWTRKKVISLYEVPGTVVRACNAEIIELADSVLLCAANFRPEREGIEPFSIVISRSFDGGLSWEPSRIIFRADVHYCNGCWEPCPRQLPDGRIQIYFANESPYRRSDEQEISMIWSDDNGDSWSDKPLTVSFTEGCRDGMPVAALFGDEIVVVIEDNRIGEFKLSTVRSRLDENWSRPVTAGSPDRDFALIKDVPDSSYMGAPYIVRLPGGEALISYQANCDGSGRWNRSCMEIAIGDRKARNFKVVCQPFRTEFDSPGLWNSLCMWNDSTVMALSSINGRIMAKRIRIVPSSHFFSNTTLSRPKKQLALP